MLARVHALLGVGPLAIYLAFHARELWSVLAGREVWTDRALHGFSHGALFALVLLPLCAHAVLGWLRLWRMRGERTPDRGLRLVQAMTGGAALLFVVYHLSHVWNPGDGPHRGLLSGYGKLFELLGQPLHLGIYLVGISALCFHFGHGLSRAATTLGLARSPKAVLAARLIAGALAFALWGAFLQVLAHFALGEPLLRLP